MGVYWIKMNGGLIRLELVILFGLQASGNSTFRRQRLEDTQSDNALGHTGMLG